MGLYGLVVLGMVLLCEAGEEKVVALSWRLLAI